MFFKFSKDTSEGMYGGDEWAMKAAGHELKSLNKLIALYIPKVHFPLMALINYLGWRVIVISLLPISTKTLVYGSADGAKHVYNNSETMETIMSQIGKLLHLREHEVQGVSIYGPADLEGHKGQDGRFYIADVPRLFPPAYIPKRRPKTHGSIWFRLLRPEFMVKYPSSLSSDAFSVMGLNNGEELNKDVAEATVYLEHTCIPRFAKTFEDKYIREVSISSSTTTLANSTSNDNLFKSFNIKNIIHEYGINCRYLFLVYMNISNVELKKLIIIEIISRVVRKLLWAEMRKFNSKKSIDKVILTYINTIFGQGHKSTVFWTDSLVDAIKKRFIIATAASDLDANEELLKNALQIESKEYRFLLYHRIRDLAGFTVLFVDIDSSNWINRIPLTLNDVVISISATTKSIQVIPYTQTYDKADDAITFYKQELKARLELVGPNHIQVANIRDHLALLYRIKGKDYFIKAEKQFMKALAIKETVYSAEHIEVASYLDQISQFYLQFGEYKKTEELLERSLEIKKKVLGNENASIAKTLDQIAQVYRKQGQYSVAKPLFKQALKMLEKLGTEDPAVATTSYNLALLYRQQGKYAKAEPLYHTALKIMESKKGPNHSWVSKILSNLAQLYLLEGRYSEAEPLFERCIKNKKKELGEHHLDTATTMNQLAQLYQKQKRYAAAAALYKDALKIRENILGADHYAVGKILDKLAELERDQDNYEVANDYFVKALEIEEKMLGPSHPYYNRVLNNYEDFKRQRSLSGSQEIK